MRLGKSVVGVICLLLFITNTNIVAQDYPIMVKVKGGKFKMGSKEGQENEKPVHTVKLGSFHISQYEITVKEYLAFCEATNDNYPEWLEAGNVFNVETGSDNFYKIVGYSRTGSDNLPIVGVNWANAVAYCKWLSEETGDKYRLPTEAEWEFAARGGRKSKGYVYSGSDNIEEVAWYKDNTSSQPQVVGTKQGNELGIHDMTGNVWEWCSDWYAANYYSDCITKDPQGVEHSTTRVLRGGSCINRQDFCRVATRNSDYPQLRLDVFGFRVVKVD